MYHKVSLSVIASITSHSVCPANATRHFDKCNLTVSIRGKLRQQFDALTTEKQCLFNLSPVSIHLAQESSYVSVGIYV